MSDQNQWPRPGQSDEQASSGYSGAPQPDGDRASDGSRASDPTSTPAPGEAPSAPQPPSAPQAPENPYGQNPSGQNPYGAQPQNPYATPGQENPYAAPGQQPGYGAPQNPYAAPSNPYAAPNQPQYAQPQYGGQQQYGQQQYGSQQQYGQQQYGGQYAGAGYQPYAQRPKTNTLSILSIVFAFAGIFIWPIVILTSPAGAIMGHVALGKIKQTGEGGRGLALTGVIGGWVMTGLWILVIGLLIALSIAARSGSGSSDDFGSTGAFIL